MAALVLKECVPTCLISIPSCVAPIVLTVDFMFWQTCFDVNCTSFPLDLNVLV